MNKRFISIALHITVLVFVPVFGSQSAYAGSQNAPLAATYTQPAFSVSFWNPVPNSDSNWVRAKVTCARASNFRLSTTLPTWPFNPANWATHGCKDNVVQIGIPSAFVASMIAVCRGNLTCVAVVYSQYRNPSKWTVTYTWK